MAIIDHGAWDYYTPKTKADDMPGNAIYAGRSDGVDWYDYVKSKPFKAGSVIMTVQLMPDGVQIVQAATFEHDGVFPPGFDVIELTGWTGSDPQTHFGWLIYDPVAKTFGERWQPPPTQTEQKIMGALDTIMSRLDKLERTHR